jgi:ribosomal protein S18 acetylase RimI-like enzyme
MDNLRIHKVNAASIPLIQELTMQVWPQTYASTLSQEQIDYMLLMMYSTEALHEQMNKGAQFIIAYYNDQPVGFASYGATEKEHEYKLHKLYVITTIQKTGAGKGLLQFVMQDVQQQGCKHLILQVNRENENAIGFYERMGFIKESEADFDIGHGFYMKDYVMGMAL